MKLLGRLDGIAPEVVPQARVRAIIGLPRTAPFRRAKPAAAWGADAPTAEWTADDARTLYSLIEERIVPAFYERDRSQVPDQWTARVRETLADALPRFTARPTLTNRSGTVAQ